MIRRIISKNQSALSSEISPDSLRDLPQGVTIRFTGEGKTGELIRSKDWSNTSLGPFESWHQTLKGYVSMILTLPTPAIIFWGENQVQIYNDGYSLIMGPRHPQYLGASYSECWPDTYPTIYPWMRRVLDFGEVVEVDRTLIPLTRHGYKEDAYFTFTFSPLKDDSGKIAGILQIVTEVTQEVFSERNLRESEERLRETFQKAAIGFAHVDLSGKWLRVNPRLCEITGYSDQELVKKTFADITHPDDLEKDLALTQELISGKIPEYSLEKRYIRKSGGIVWVNLNVSLNRDSEGKPRYFIVSVDNITERIFAEEAVKIANVRFELASEVAEVGVWEWRIPTNEIEYVGKQWKIMGFPAPVFSPSLEAMFEKIHPRDRERIREALNRAIQEKREYIDEFRVIWPDGSIHWLMAKSRTFYDDLGRPHRMLGINLDISKQRRALAEITKREEQLRATLEVLPIGVGIADPNGKIILMNQKSREIWAGEATSNQTWNDYFEYKGFWPESGRRLEAHEWPLARAIREKKTTPSEIVEVECFDRTHKTLIVSAAPIVDSGENTLLGAVYAIQDITELKKTEVSLKNALRARDEFMSIASHELKTPLSSLKLQSELMKRRLQKNDPQFFSPDRVSRMIDQSEKQIRKLVRLVDDMLDVSRIESGKLTIQPELTELSELVQEVVERLKPQMIEAGTLPFIEKEPGEKFKGYWDPFRIEQVVTNLLTNAMRYGNKQPVTVRIEQQVDKALLSVHDQGIGISKEMQSRIFNRFERGVSANEVSGLGLGLYITQQIVKAHGGKVWVQSEEGKGSTFFVELPLADKNAGQILL